ncbi:SpaA isopeptide-forming pilin-related protein [uncultured Eubacterium sp.]|uniref:SpaA isopeptide-forming pilin-related protein n=1 Tax=uncultured Eubacterium sp. TaxID=165185 RepID=UPI00262F26C5|nr:SpaA isopeptide-forming pilin-related protein [uncultured Eubacterium sp.]
MKKFIKRSTSLFLAVLMCFSSLIGVTATAHAATKQDVYIIDLPRGKETNKEHWGHPAYELMNGWSTFNTDYVTVKAIGDYEGDSCYCIEPGVSLYTGDKLSKEAESFWDNYPSKYNKTIDPDTIKVYLGRIMQYGYTGKNSVDWVSTNSSKADDCANHLATQLLVWETVIGERDENFNHVDATKSGKHNIKEIISSKHPLRSKILSHYSRIEKSVKQHTTVPSFASRSKSKAKSIELKWNGKNYSTTISDTNGVLSNYDFSGSGLTFSKSGNSLTITAEKAPKDDVLITVNKKNSQRKAVITWTDEKIGPQSGQLQDIVTFGQSVSDPVKAYLNVKVSLGNAKLMKVSEDGEVANVRFHISGNGISKDVTTNANGEINIVNLAPGNYQISEYTDVKYVPQDTQTVTIVSGQTASVHFSNVLKKFRVNVTKQDYEKGHAQGDAKLSGAVYGLFKGNDLVAQYTTDSNGSFTTDYFVCGTDWTVREITPSEGYLLNDTVYRVGADPRDYNIEYNTAPDMTVMEQVIKGKISIIKHTDDGETQIETPEKGAEFQVYLKSSGSFVNADKDERDTIVCDQDGFASTKLLPYGVYTVHQTKGWAGRELITDFDVFISTDGKTYKFLINNKNFESYLKVVKLDKETGKRIAYEGAAFEIYDSDNHRVTMQYTYPQVTSIHTFYTNKEGYLITPEKLPYGDYTLKEVQAPYGYVLDDTPIPFSITQENSSTDTGVTVVKVKARDMAQKGVINITKTGEVFSSVEENNGVYTPKYSVGNLKGAVFEIYAAEDITTLDGTVRYDQGSLVDTITTDDDGVAKSKELYLGKYTVIEKTAPNGYVHNSTKYDIELIYAGQNVSVTSTAVSVYNDRQKVAVSLKKEMNEDKTFNLGKNNEISFVQFGIYANEDIKASNGDIIPKDALITFANCDKNGSIVFDCDLPIGFKWYVKEIATDKHYILSDTKYEFDTEYQGQDVKVIDIKINNGEAIENNLIYGSVKGLKVDRETQEVIKGATFGLFFANTSELTEKNAVLTAVTDENGIFTFTNVPYGEYIIKELNAAEGYLDNEDIFKVTISTHEQTIELTPINDKIPELKTTATIDGNKEVNATEVFTLTDTVEYKHLVPGKEYALKGVLMNKATGKALEIDGKEITSEVKFTPEQPSGTVDVLFTFDSKFIKTETQIVAFEYLYKDGKELTTHTDIEDEGQTVTIHIPSIKTTAKANDKKKATAKSKLTITDTVSYENLTPGKEYEITGVLMDKATGKAFIVKGKEVTSTVKFTPDKANGTVEVKFTFDASNITKSTDLVVFESLYRDNVEIAVHADLKDKGQTVTIVPPTPKTPKTSDNRNLGTWIGLGGVGLGAGIAALLLKLKMKKDEDE